MIVELEAPPTVAVGDLVVARVRVINDGPDPVSLSRWFHLHEGDVAIVFDGDRHIGAEQIDSLPRTVAVDPGFGVGGGVSLVATDRGVLFAEPGPHRLAVSYWGPGLPAAARSEEVAIEVVDGDPVFAPDVAISLAGGYVEPGRVDLSIPGSGRLVALASAIRAGDWPDLGADEATERLRADLGALPAEDLAWVATGLAPPAPLDDDPLLVAARTVVDASDPTATAILGGEPFEVDG